MTTSSIKFALQTNSNKVNYSTSSDSFSVNDDFDYELFSSTKKENHNKRMSNNLYTFNLINEWLNREVQKSQEFNIIDVKKLNNIQKLNKLKVKKLFYYSNLLLNRVKIIIDLSIVQPTITPSNRKSIYLRYDNGNGKFLTFELYSFKYTFVLVPEKCKQYDINNFYTEEHLPYDFKKIEEIIKGFYGEEIGEISR